jgi:hypothetical protein
MTPFVVKWVTIDAREHTMTDEKPDPEATEETAEKKFEPAEDVEAHSKKFAPTEKKFEPAEDVQAHVKKFGPTEKKFEPTEKKF